MLTQKICIILKYQIYYIKIIRVNSFTPGHEPGVLPGH